jgi:hypothetical protein
LLRELAESARPTDQSARPDNPSTRKHLFGAHAAALSTKPIRGWPDTPAGRVPSALGDEDHCDSAYELWIPVVKYTERSVSLGLVFLCRLSPVHPIVDIKDKKSFGEKLKYKGECGVCVFCINSDFRNNTLLMKL